MLQKFQEHINQRFPDLRNKKLLVAISGGVDSVVLVHLLNELNYDVSLAHCNFKLRKKESDKDEKFVKNVSQISSNQIFTKFFETEDYAKKHKISIQAAARELRYSWFLTLVEKYQFSYILTAHHANDNLETIVFNLTRGTGLDGLTGIPAQNGNILRPLLPFSKVDIENYAKENKLTWREDKSNASLKYSRNKIRHQIIPLLEELNPSILESTKKTIHHLQEVRSILEEKTAEVYDDVVVKEPDSELLKIDIGKLKKYSNSSAYLYQILKKYDFKEWNDVYNLLNAQSGKKVLSKKFQLIKDRGFLIVAKIKDDSDTEQVFYIYKYDDEKKLPISLNFESAPKENAPLKTAIVVDKDLLNYPLILRKWKKGDYFYPTGMQGKKKLSKFFKDEKFSILDKAKTWFLCDSDDKIVWVIKHRQDRRFVGKSNLKITTE